MKETRTLVTFDMTGLNEDTRSFTEKLLFILSFKKWKKFAPAKNPVIESASITLPKVSQTRSISHATMRFKTR